MSAEFGYGSSTVNVSIKSGTNKLHGAGWEFLRNDAMDARLFFATRKPPLRRNQFGANAGGPVWIPKLYNGRDKTFWFFNYEGLRLRQGQSFAPSVPTARMRTGDLSELPNAIYDPATTVPDPSRPKRFYPAAVSGECDPTRTHRSDCALLPESGMDSAALAAGYRGEPAPGIQCTESLQSGDNQDRSSL